MKKIFNFIKEKIWILILLVLILGAVIAVLKEHTFYFGISVGLSLLLFSISSKCSDI